MNAHERLYRSALGRSRPSDDSHVEEYSFKPQTDPKIAKRFAHVKSHYAKDDVSLMEHIREEHIRKEETLAEQRRMFERQQEEVCTFAPETWKPYGEPQQPVVVSGLGRFFELRGLAQR